MRQIFILVFLIVGFGPSSGFAQNANRWSRLDPANGLGVGVCSTTDRHSCLYVRCGAGRGLEFTFTSATGAYSGQKSVKIAIDQNPLEELSWEAGEPGSVRIDESFEYGLLDALKSGSKATIIANGKSYPLRLSGSSRSIDYATKNCKALAQRQGSGVNSFGNAYERWNDEATMSFPPKQTDWSYERYKNTDFWGGDIRHGIDDALLRAMTVDQCEALCSVTKGCLAYTHNGDENVCFLKSGVGKVKRFKNATSGQLDGSRYSLVPPPTKGPGLIIDSNLSWKDSDSRESWYRRLRDASKRLGGSCEAEREQVESLAEKIQFSLTKDVSKVGDFATIRWTGNDLVERIPVWIQIASSDPIRFSGNGSFSLGPDAPNPFNIAYKNNETRNLVALFSRGAGENGQVRVFPLVAGATNLSFAIVAYLRECEEEIVIQKGGSKFEIQPNTPKIVVNSGAGLASLTHRVQIPKYDREILFNANRVVVRTLDQKTEILISAGSELTVSPTHRFIAFKHLNKFQIVDVLDGKKVAQLRAGLTGGELRWALEGSYILSTSAPWGEVNIASLFGDGFLLERQITGPSCCVAGEHTRVAIDIENAVVSIWGNGHQVASLQNQKYQLSENNGSGWAIRGTGHSAVYADFWASVGSVAPVSFTQTPLVVGGFKPTVGENDESLDSQPTEEENWKTLRSRLSKVGLQVVALETRISQDSEPLESTFHTNASRLKIELAETINGENLVSDNNGYTLVERLANAQSVLDELAAELAKNNWSYQWTSIPDAYDAESYNECDHVYPDIAEYPDGQGPKLSDTTLNNDIFQLQRIQNVSDDIWIYWTNCEAGATFGTLRGQSALSIIDFAKPYLGNTDHVVVERAWYWANSRRQEFFEYPFETKATTNFAIGYAPKNGVIWLFDRDQRKIVYVGENLPNGDLLQNAWITADNTHIVQLNSDGSLYFHRVEDGETVLNGRIDDDEIAVWTDDFRFDATAEAATAITLRFPGIEGHFSLDRFDSIRRTPDLARRILNGEKLPLLNAGLPVPPAVDGTIVLQESTISIAGVVEKGNVQDIQVFQDGVLTSTIAAVDKTGSFEFEVERLKDSRWISVVARDSNLVESLPMTKDLGLSETQASVQRALVIGVDRYNSSMLQDLNYAKSDAGRVYSALQRDNNNAPRFETIAGLTDRKASRAAIISETTKMLEGLSKGDHAVFFFAGHGLQDAEGRFYLGTPNADTENLEDTALPWDVLADIFASSDARITVFLDACHSGAASSGAFATNDAAVGGINATASNLTIIAASKGREFSQESGVYQGGLFSVALENLLNNRVEFDENRNGSIEASELYRGVKSQVVAFEGANQTPWMVKNQMVGDYAIF